MKDAKEKVSSWHNERCFHMFPPDHMNTDEVWEDNHKPGNNGFFREGGTRIGKKGCYIYLHSSTCYNTHVLLLYFKNIFKI